MRKKLLTVLAVTVVVALATVVASAQTQITLGNSTQNVLFTATGGSTVNVRMGNCVSGTCTLSGVAFGGSAANPSSPNGNYSIVTTGNVFLTQTATTPVDHIFTVNQTGTMAFNYFNGSGNLLSGNLSLLTLEQAPGSTTGEFNTGATANLQITGGSLASIWTNQAILTVTVQFGSRVHGLPTDLSTLFGPNSCGVNPRKPTTIVCKTASGPLVSGNVNPTPEPSSMLLFGTGLVALGGFLRKRIA